MHTGEVEPVLKIFSACLFSLFANAVNAEHCNLADLAVSQTIVPGKVNGQTMYMVEAENRCICSQENVKLSCPGFNSSMSMGVDKQVLRPDGDRKLCTLNDGHAISMGPDYAVQFTYASSSQISFAPVSSTIASS